jgi:hypothetical protein
VLEVAGGVSTWPAASTAREDGTARDNRYLDHDRAQRACRALEARHALANVKEAVTPRGKAACAG